MIYNESGYYPPGAEFDPNAPYNQKEPEEMDFKVYAENILIKYCPVTTTDYIEECDEDEDGIHYKIDTENTDWKKTYYESNHLNIGDLIKEFKVLLQEKISTLKDDASKKHYLELLEECEGWTLDDEYYTEDK